MSAHTPVPSRWPVLLFAGVALFASAQPSAAQFFSREVSDTIPQIAAGASVSVPVAPDRVVIYASLVGRDSVGQAAVAEATAVRGRVVAALGRLGVRANQITPWGFGYGRESGQQSFGGPPPPMGPGTQPRREPQPTARLGLRIVLERLDRLDQVLAALAEAGADGVPFVSYEVTRDAEPRRQAAERAVAQARTEAEAIARAAGGRLGELISIVTLPDFGEGPSSTMRFFSYPGGGFERGSVPLNPSDVSVRVRVQAAWRFRRD